MQTHEQSAEQPGGAIKPGITTARLQKMIEDMANFSLDAVGATRPFSKKLQEQQGWSPEYTARAIEEYKRYMVLAAITATEVTPSQTVDEVWHLHLQYSKSYRDEMCGKILKTNIDHNPGNGAEEEGERYSAQYLKTLLLYMTVFGEKPPSDIWQCSDFDRAGLERGISLAATRKRASGESAGVSEDDAIIFLGDVSLPQAPAVEEHPHPCSSPATATPGGAEAPTPGFWSSMMEFFGFGSSPNEGHSSSPSSWTAEVDTYSGGEAHDASGWGGWGGDGGVDAGCGGGGCGGGGCGGGGCGGGGE